MKTFFIILLVAGGIYFIAFYLWPLIFSLYLRFLSDRILEAYLIKCYRRFKENPRDFNDKYITHLLELATYSSEFWNETKSSAHDLLLQESDIQERAYLQEDILYYDQKIEFWSDALETLQQEIKRREYFNSFRN